MANNICFSLQLYACQFMATINGDQTEEKVTTFCMNGGVTAAQYLTRI